MKTKNIQELYQIKLHSMDTILHQISLMDKVEDEQELSEIIHSLLQANRRNLLYGGKGRDYALFRYSNGRRKILCLCKTR